MSIQQMGNVTVVNQNTKRETGRKAQLGNIAAAKVCPSIHHLLKKKPPRPAPAPQPPATATDPLFRPIRNVDTFVHHPRWNYMNLMYHWARKSPPQGFPEYPPRKKTRPRFAVPFPSSPIRRTISPSLPNSAPLFSISFRLYIVHVSIYSQHALP